MVKLVFGCLVAVGVYFVIHKLGLSYESLVYTTAGLAGLYAYSSN